jgi:hypothetical protein
MSHHHHGIPSEQVCARMASIIGRDGIDAPEAGRQLGIQAKSAVRILRQAMKLGMLFETRHPKHGNWRVFFTSAEDRDVYAERTAAERKAIMAERNREKEAKKRERRALLAKQRPEVVGRKDFAVELLQTRRSLTAAQLAEAAGCNSRQASSSLVSAVAAGQAFVGKINAHVAVYFATEEEAAKLRPVPPKRIRIKTQKRAESFDVAPDAEGVAPTVTVKNHGRQKLCGETIYPPGFKKTVAAAPPANRWVSDESSVPREFRLKYELEREGA